MGGERCIRGFGGSIGVRDDYGDYEKSEGGSSIAIARSSVVSVSSPISGSLSY